MKTRVFALFLLIFSFTAGHEIYASDCRNVRKDWKNVKTGDVKCETYALRSVILKENLGVLEVKTINFKKFQVWVWPENVEIRVDNKLDGTYADVYFKHANQYFVTDWEEIKFIIYVRKPEQKVRFDALLKNYMAPRDVLLSVIK